MAVEETRVQIVRLQCAADMNLNDARVKKALEARFASSKFDPTETVVTPDSLFNDDQLVEIAR